MGKGRLRLATLVAAIALAPVLSTRARASSQEPAQANQSAHITGSCTDDTQCDDGEFCNGVETCGESSCDPGVDPCPVQVCDETIDTCLSGLCDAPLAEAVGSRYIAITPQPTDSTEPQAFIVEPTCDDGIARYVGSLRCGPTGDACRSDADCNKCSFGHNSCLSDDDCYFGFCDNGAECNIFAQNCADQSECVRVDYCELSGDQCVPGELIPVDINRDGLFDGYVATLVDDPESAAFLTPAQWGASLTRCDKTAIPCDDDTDCERGVCGGGAPCSVLAQNCLDASTCLRDEHCAAGRVYITAQYIVPSEFAEAIDRTAPEPVDGEPTFKPTTYNIRANCGTVSDEDLSLSTSATMWRWADTNGDAYVNVTDILYITLGIQGSYFYSSSVNDDIAGQIVCEPQGVINVTDVQMALRAIQGEQYVETGCHDPCGG